MDSTSSFALLSFLFSTLTLFFAMSSGTTRVASTIKPRRLYTDLIHHTSIFSPSYNPHYSVADHAKHIAKNSAARLAYIQSKVKTKLATSNDIQAHLDTNTETFLVKFSIGQPPVPQLAVMDTGSYLVWVKCDSCISSNTSNCFDSSKSSSYATSSCHDANCYCLRSRTCDASNECKFSITYENLITAEGVLATEQFTFETFDGGRATVPNVSFGCSTNGGDDHLRRTGFNGIFGLGDSPISLVSKMGNKFSYCIGNINDLEYSYNKLVIGGAADIEGYSTPLETYRGFYYVSLEAISIGEVTFDIDPTVFKGGLLMVMVEL